MQSALPGTKTLLSAASALVAVLNLGFWILPLTVTTIIRFLFGQRWVQRRCNLAIEGIYRAAVRLNSLWMTRVIGIGIQVQGDLPGHPAPIVVSNHQSWFDIPVIQHIVTRRGPILKFLIKRELVWLPLVGWICYALGFPRLRRGKGDRARQQDHAAVEAFSSSQGGQDGALMLFAEGTRFTGAKRVAQASPYRHLLKPKPGGLKIMLEASPPGTPVVDVTIIYHGDTNFWQCLGGETKRITAKIHVVPAEDIGDAKGWLAERWEHKDREISAVISAATGENPC